MCSHVSCMSFVWQDAFLFLCSHNDLYFSGQGFWQGLKAIEAWQRTRWPKGMLCHTDDTCRSMCTRGSQNKGGKMRVGCLTPAFSGAQKWVKKLHISRVLGDPKTKGDKIRIGCLTPTFSGAQRWEGMRHNPALSGIPKQRGTKSELAAESLPSGGLQMGANAMSPLHSRGSPNIGGQN